MYKLKIFSIGKTKTAWLQNAIGEYTRRLQPILSIEWAFARDDLQLEKLLEKEESYVALEPDGKLYTSEEFSSWLETSLEKGGSRLSLVIGGAEGIPAHIAEKAKEQLSFSPMTFTHQITRLVLLEQVYRAFEIVRGSDYHK